MEGGILGPAALAHPRGEGLVQGGGGQRCRPVPGGEHPGAGPLALPVRSSQRQPPGGQWHAAVFAPCAATSLHQHPLRVQVGTLHLRALRKAPPPGVDPSQTHRGGRGLDPGQEGPHCLRTPHARQFLGVPGPHEVEDRPRALARAFGEEPDPVEVNPAGARGACLLLASVEAILAELLVAALGRRASVVVRQLAHSGDLTRWRRRGKPPKLPVFQPAASTGGHGHPPVRVAHDPSPTVDTHRRIDCRAP